MNRKKNVSIYINVRKTYENNTQLIGFDIKIYGGFEMKKIFNRTFSIVLAIVMVFGATPLAGLVGFDLPASDFFVSKAEAALENIFLWPVPSSYSMSRAFSEHKAIDINKCEGKDIVAAYDGTVYSYVNKCQHYSKSCTSCDSTGMGVGLILKHKIDGTTYYTYYAHMKYNSVPSAYRTTGVSVKQGEVIGKVGSSGNSTGPHMHFAITKNETWNNYVNTTPTNSSKHNITSSSGISYKYTTASYTLTYNANGGSGAPTSQTGSSSYTISSVYPERFGYTFEGWATSSNASYIKYLPGESITLSSNTTLYAVWSNEFDYNDGYTAYSSNYIQFIGQERYYKFIPSASGYYIFDTSNTDEGLDTKGYLYNSSGTELAYNDDGNITGNGSVATDFRIIYNLTARNTYYIKVKGWGSDTGFFMICAYEDSSLYYNANGGSGAPTTQFGATNYTISSTVPKRDNYTFLGWSKSSSATSPEYKPGDYIELDGPTTLYAIWKKNATYTLTYNANGGSGAPSSQTKTYGTDLTLSSTKPTRTGYTFTGWNTKADGTGTSYASGSKYKANAAVTLYAQWEKKTYKVSYDANGGSGAPSSQTKTYGTDLTLSSTKPTRTGYTFTGWNTKADGTGTSYASGAKYTANSAVTLYAQWEKVTYTLTYNANGGVGTPTSQSGATSYTISSIKPTRSGYTLLGWSESSSATSASYVAGDTINISANTILYAVWQKNVVVEETPAIKIRNNPGSRAINHGEILHMVAETQNMPEGAKISWRISNDSTGVNGYIDEADNTSCYIQATGSGSCTVYALVVDADGNPILDKDGNEIYDSQKITVNSGLWQRIISFFKNLFGMNRVIVQAFKSML